MRVRYDGVNMDKHDNHRNTHRMGRYGYAGQDKRDNKRNTHRMGRYGYAGNAISRGIVGKSAADSIRLGFVPR